MPRYNTHDDEDDESRLSPSGRPEFRQRTTSQYPKPYQAERIRPAIQYLRDRFGIDKPRPWMRYNDISRHTGLAYNHVGTLLTQGTSSLTFFDMVLLADAAGTSLDYLGEMTGLFHPERVVDPGHTLFLSDEEAELIRRLRQVQASPARDALVAGFVESLEKLHATPTKAKAKRPTKTQPPVPSATR